MSDPKKLDSGQKHLLRLIAKSQESPEGWAPTSAPIHRLMGTMPAELVEIESVGDEGRGRVRLTQAGQNLLDAMEWL